MTANELQRLVVRLSNSCWVRHWLCQGRTGQPAEMWVQVLDKDLDGAFLPQRLPHKQMEQLGFAWHDCHGFYIIPRTNDDGTPYIVQL